MAVLRTLLYRAEVGFDESIRPEAISEVIPDARNVLWLDIESPTAGDLELLRREFGFHELALEDVVTPHERAKIDQYPGYCFIVFYAARPGHLQEIKLFVGENYLVTAHAGPFPEVAETAERWQRNASRLEPGVGVLVYSLLDTIVDGYFGVVDDLAERLDALETMILDGRAPRNLDTALALKRELLRLRRVLTPERDVLNMLVRRDEPIFSTTTLLYFQDVYDHLLRVLDSIDLYRDQFAAALDVYLSAVSNRLNVVMKRMTALSTILMTLALIAGIYGMNFRLTPSQDEPLAFWWVVGAMAALGLALTAYFRRIDWL